MYALQVSTNDRGGTPQYVGAIFGDDIEELVSKLDYPDTEAVATWMRNNAETLVEWVEKDPSDTYFCGDSGKYRFDLQLADGKST